VKDILAELLPRLRSLERQAKRAQEYEQVKADLQVLLRDWYGYHWHNAQMELTEALRIVRVQEKALDKARLAQQDQSQELAKLRDETGSLRASLNSWHRQSAQLHNRREALSRELAVAGERLRSLQEQEQRALGERARLDEDLGVLQQRLSETVQETRRLEADLQEARSQAENARRLLSARQAERARLEKELGAARQNLSGLNARQSQFQARLAERQQQAGRSQKALEDANRLVDEALARQKNAAARSQESQERLREAELSWKQAEDSVSQHRQLLAATDARHKEAVEERATAAAGLARLKAQLDVIERNRTASKGRTEP
jgi:chromosome segregation protein